MLERERISRDLFPAPPREAFFFRVHRRSWPVSNFHDYFFFPPFSSCASLLSTAVPHSSFSFSLSLSRSSSLLPFLSVKFYGQDYLFADLSVFYYTRSFHALPYLFSCLLYDIYSSARLCSAPVITARAPLEEEWAVVPKCRGKKNAGRH